MIRSRWTRLVLVLVVLAAVGGVIGERMKDYPLWSVVAACFLAGLVFWLASGWWIDRGEK